MITELVGPSGSGKTTLLATLEEEQSMFVMTVPRIFNSADAGLMYHARSVRALLRGVFKATALSYKNRVPLSATLRLARNCVAVEHAYSCVDQLEGDWLVDEGPLRQLRDRQCGSGTELVAWKLYATEIIDRMIARRQDWSMVVLEVPRNIYERRHKVRNLSELRYRRLVGGFRNRLGLFLDGALRPTKKPTMLGSFVDEAFAAINCLKVHVFQYSADEAPEQVSRRFIREVIFPLKNQ